MPTEEEAIKKIYTYDIERRKQKREMKARHSKEIKEFNQETHRQLQLLKAEAANAE